MKILPLPEPLATLGNLTLGYLAMLRHIKAVHRAGGLGVCGRHTRTLQPPRKLVALITQAGADFQRGRLHSLGLFVFELLRE